VFINNKLRQTYCKAIFFVRVLIRILPSKITYVLYIRSRYGVYNYGHLCGLSPSKPEVTAGVILRYFVLFIRWYFGPYYGYEFRVICQHHQLLLHEEVWKSQVIKKHRYVQNRYTTWSMTICQWISRSIFSPYWKEIVVSWRSVWDIDVFVGETVM